MKVLTKNAVAIILMALCLGLTSCPDPAIPEGDDAEFTHFEFAYMLNAADINRHNRTIRAEIDSDADVENLIPTFVLSHGATAHINNVTQISGVTGNNFSKIVEYKIVSGNKKTILDWYVIIVPKIGHLLPPGNYQFCQNSMLLNGNYSMNGEIIICDGVYLEIQPGAKLNLGQNTKFIIGKGARFIVRGTNEQPIIFTSETPEAKWDGFVFNQTKEAEFHFCEFSNAGQTGSQFMKMNSNDNDTTATIGITNSKFTNINSTGFSFDNNSMIRVFDNNTLTNVATDNNDYLIQFSSINSASNLGENNTITNSNDILIKNGLIKTNITLVGQKNCSYIIENDIRCSDTNITFFIRNGAVIKMAKDKEIILGNTKMVFKAEGLFNKPIIFEGIENERGYWKGIYIGEHILNTSYLLYCNILDAGNGETTGAIKCDKTESARLTIGNCNIKNTNSHGIYFTPKSNANLIGLDGKIEVIPPYETIYYCP